ncbi:hypothetical protein C8039_05890 [Halogeometricum sp. wsp3]|nr:hypothetical protein C8039_05890 [Halogeometricum sp. wsp3]
MKARVALVAGTTETAGRAGISAAGADPELMSVTPAADAELVTYGTPVRTDVTPVSPSGCPTPALVTRAAREVLGFAVTVVDGGLAEKTAAPTVSVGARPGKDIAEQDPVSTAHGAFAAARQFGQSLPADELYLGETIPGGTTTALGVLRAQGRRDGLRVAPRKPHSAEIGGGRRGTASQFAGAGRRRKRTETGGPPDG